MLTIDKVPDDCLNGACDCLEIGFTTDNLVESPGSLDPVVISGTDVADFQIGTTVAVNGAIFSVAAAENAELNQVLFSGSPATMIANLETVLNSNYYILKNDTVAIVGSDLHLTPKKAIFQTDLILDNLSGGVSNKEVSFLANPVIVRPGYSAMVCMTDAETGEDLGEVRVYAIPQANSDFTNIQSYRIEKDVGAIIKKSLSSPLPNIETTVAPSIMDVTGVIRRVTFTAAEVYGSPLNHFQQLINPDEFLVLNGGVRKGESLDDKCNGLLKLEGDLIKVSCNQPFWLYKHIAQNASPIIYFHSVEFFDVSGALLGSGTINNINSQNKNLLGFESGLPQMNATMSALGVNVDEVYRYRITVTSTAGGLPIDTYMVEFEVANLVNPEVLVFKNSLGTFSSIFVQSLSSAALNAAQEFIQLCTPCGASVDEKGTFSTRVNDSFDLLFTLFNYDCYDCRMVEELFSSTEVYWLRNDLLYHLQAQNEDVVVFQKNTNINTVFNAKLYY